jgi:hypothetical protein
MDANREISCELSFILLATAPFLLVLVSWQCLPRILMDSLAFLFG